MEGSWEYVVNTFCHPDYYHGSGALQRHLADMGEARWELVTVLTFPHPGEGPAGLVLYWKRPSEG